MGGRQRPPARETAARTAVAPSSVAGTLLAAVLLVAGIGRVLFKGPVGAIGAWLTKRQQS